MLYNKRIGILNTLIRFLNKTQESRDWTHKIRHKVHIFRGRW